MMWLVFAIARRIQYATSASFLAWVSEGTSVKFIDGIAEFMYPFGCADGFFLIFDVLLDWIGLGE